MSSFISSSMLLLLLVSLAFQGASYSHNGYNQWTPNLYNTYGCNTYMGCVRWNFQAYSCQSPCYLYWSNPQAAVPSGSVAPTIPTAASAAPVIPTVAEIPRKPCYQIAHQPSGKLLIVDKKEGALSSAASNEAKISGTNQLNSFWNVESAGRAEGGYHFQNRNTMEFLKIDPSKNETLLERPQYLDLAFQFRPVFTNMSWSLVQLQSVNNHAFLVVRKHENGSLSEAIGSTFDLMNNINGTLWNVTSYYC
ncbi:uncharacterized protein LOC129749401 [Uranotaenia lowii]|uniref:uncharacterized protein LOC129749401 n=1 Tax=Uranotaenia lowii TaxID=190385 RepID=UPI0024796185|nr:uncharacterized protein LOC129749401 [Uranotaenia lowii]